jgi:hypothetical protein
MIRVRGFWFCGLFRWGSGRAAGGLVVAVGVDGELAEEFAGGGVDDADVEVVDEHQDAGSGVGPADADVVEFAVVAEGELAVGVDAVGADPVVGIAGAVAGGCLGPGVVGGERCLAVGQGAVRAAGVVVGGEGIQEFLELGEVSGLGLGGEPFLQGLPESLDLALGLGVVRAAVLLPDPQAAQLVLQGVAAASAAGEPRGVPWAVQAARNDPVTTGPVTRWWAVRCSTYREWSSSQQMISVSVPPASRQWVKSDCQHSLGSSAANRR